MALPAPASAWPAAPPVPVTAKMAAASAASAALDAASTPAASADGAAVDPAELDSIDVVKLETWNKVAATAVSSGVGAAVVWDSLGNFSELRYCIARTQLGAENESMIAFIHSKHDHGIHI